MQVRVDNNCPNQFDTLHHFKLVQLKKVCSSAALKLPVS